MNGGYGIEDNHDNDLIAGLRKRNQTYRSTDNTKFSPRLIFALEYRRVLTDWFFSPQPIRS